MPSYAAIELEWERCPDGVEVVVRDEPPFTGGLMGFHARTPTIWRSGEEAEGEIELLRQREQMDQDIQGVQIGWPSMVPQVGPQRWVRPVTPRRTQVSLYADRIDQPKVIDLVNAKDEGALLAFVHTYGIPVAKHFDGTEGIAVYDIERCRDALGLLLYLHQEGPKQRMKIIHLFERLANGWLSTILPRLTMPPWADSPQLTLRPTSLLGYMLLEAGMIMSGNTRVMRCVHCGKVFMSGVDGAKRRSAIYCSNRCRVAEQRALAKRAETGA